MWSIRRSPAALWLAFVLTHLWLGLVNLYGPGLPLGDVTIVYRFWADQIFLNGFWVGIDSAWVYPIVAIFPMIAADIFGPQLYASTWLSMILMMNAAAFFVLTGRARVARNAGAAWWWIVFLLLLGPIALGRIDSVTVPLAMIGALFIAVRPLLASVLFTVSVWIKVWPAAILVAMVVAVKQRWQVLSVAISVSALIIAAALLAGSGSNVVSFVSQQTGRGLQVESPVSTLWLWQAFFGVSGTHVYYDQFILTWQVSGNGTGAASALMTPVMVLAVAAVVLVAVLALRRGADPAPLVAVLSLALVATLIAFNKVGSPQFIAWLSVPLVLGLTTKHSGNRWWFAVPAVMGLVVAGLTQLIYPYFYGWLLGLHPLLLVALSVRNLLIFAILAWAVVVLWRLGAPHQQTMEQGERIDGEPRAWPLDLRA